MSNFRYVGDHADTVVKADDALLAVAPGDFVELTDEELENNQHLNLVLVSDLEAVSPVDASADTEEGGKT